MISTRLSCFAAAAAALCLAALPAAAAFGAESCPNEQLRVEDNSTRLPECRAYELVSPAIEQAAYGSRPIALSQNGDALIYNSVGSRIGEPDHSPSANIYSATRTREGWLSTPEDPLPTEAFDATSNKLTDVSPSLEAQVWEGKSRVDEVSQLTTHKPGEGFNLTGFGLVGFQEPDYGGGSSNLEDLIFNNGSGLSSSTLLPVDPGAPNPAVGQLYEITKAGTNAPELSYVALQNNGQALNTSAAEVTLGSTAASGAGSHEGSDYNAISASGARIFFDVAPISTYNGDTSTQVFARVGGRETVDLSEPTAANCAACVETSPLPAAFAGASEEGEKAFFTTEQELLPGQSTRNIYEYDFNEPAGHRILLVSAGSSTPEVQGVVRISNDGSHAYFVAKGRLTSTPNAAGEAAETGADNLYVANTSAHTVTFIARLCSGQDASGTLADARCSGSGSDSELWGAQIPRQAQATPDGQYLVFASNADLTAGDTSTVAQIFRYDTATGELTRLSTGEDGYANNGNTTSQPATLPGGFLASGTVEDYQARADYENSAEYKRAISESGESVIFITTDALSERAINASPNLYEWHEGHVSLISDGAAPHGLLTSINGFGSGVIKESLSTVMISASGNDILFDSTAALVGQDTNTGTDLYDARTGGGFPAPAPEEPKCSAEACQGSLSPLFAAPSPVGSATQAAGENLTSGGPKLPGEVPKRAGDASAAVSATVTGRDAALRVACRGGGCKGTLKLTAKIKHGQKTKTVVVGRTSFAIAKGKSKTVEVKLDEAAMKLLKRRGRLTAKLTGKGIKSRTIKLTVHARKHKAKAMSKAHRDAGRPSRPEH